MDGYTYLAPESSRLPLSTSRVPEGFPLGGEVSIAAVKQEMLESDQAKEKNKKKIRGEKRKRILTSGFQTKTHHTAPTSWGGQ